MNKNILNALIAGSVAMGLAGCSENSWNDHYLDGFEGGASYDKSEEGAYTLTDADYATIASEMRAIATNKADSAAAKAIGTNLYFDKNGVYSAANALPTFLNTSNSPYYLAANGSTVDVTYREVGEVPAEIAALSGAKTYTLSEADYIGVWGSDVDYIQGFAPIAPAAASLPGILATALPGTTEGTYAVVTYQEASTNPVFTTEETTPTIYIDESFSESIGDFTLEDVLLPEGSTYVWKHDSYNDEGYMKASGFVKKACRDSEGWLLSPIVALSESANAVLTFEQAWKNFASLDNAKSEATVWVREEGGEWAQLTPSTLPENTSYDFYATGDIDLSAYNGKSIQIGFRYKSTTKSAGTWEVRNIVLQDGTASRAVNRALAAEVPTEGKNAVYYFNGSKWTVADGALALNPADYTAMGFKNNKLSDPDVYIPLYLKTRLPYALSGDEVFVVYNGTKADLFVFDGSVWTLNNNGLETVTGRFLKKDGKWSFQKYIGKAIFVEFAEQQIILDRSYLFISGDKAGVVIDKNNTYGYILTTDVAIVDKQIILSSDANAYLFATSFDNDGTIVKAPEGKFLIKDSYNRYLYLSGTYNSANLKTTPDVKDGAIADNFLWTATANGDGTWSIANVANGKKWYYSSKYSNFAAYDQQSENDSFPSLYILSE